MILTWEFTVLTVRVFCKWFDNPKDLGLWQFVWTFVKKYIDQFNWTHWKSTSKWSIFLPLSYLWDRGIIWFSSWILGAKETDCLLESWFSLLWCGLYFNTRYISIHVWFHRWPAVSDASLEDYNLVDPLVHP